MRILFFKFLILFIILITISCENDSEQDLIDSTPILSIATYENSVEAIIDDNCTFCHNDPPINFAPMPLLTFDQVTDAVINRGLLDRVSTQNANLVMPPTGRLPQATIDLILQWNTDGLLEQ